MKVNGSSSYPRTWLRWPVASSACGLESRTPGVACRSSGIKTSAEGHSTLNTSSLANYTSSSSPSSSSLSLSHQHQQQLERVLAVFYSQRDQQETPQLPSQQPTMRAASILALGCYAAVSSAKDVLEDIEDSAQDATSSVASAVESVTSSAVSKPTFTVSPAIGS